MADERNRYGVPRFPENPWQEGASGQAAPFEPDTGARPVLRYGARGEGVVRLQRRLNLHGADIVEDAIWGSNTNAAVTAFQAQHNLAVDGIVGPLTWAELDRNPQAAGPTPTGDAHSVLGVQGDLVKGSQPAARQPVGAGSQKEPNITDVEKYRPGPFASFVSDDRLDRQAACLLHYMALAPAFSWARDTPEFVHQELSNGNLLGIVKASDAAKMAAKAHSSHRATITATQPTGGAEYKPFKDQGVSRGYCVLANDFFTPPTMRMPILMLSHEINHHRVRDIADVMAKEPAGQKLTDPHEYVLADVAKKYAPGVIHTRKQFVVELTARHVAWHVAQQYDTKIAKTQPKQKSMPTPGRFFKAAFDYAKGDPNSYNDNGYMVELARRGDEVLGKQVALWMRQMNRMEFHNLPTTSDAVGAWFLTEYQVAEAANFKPSGVGEGLA
jgi:peptidoglycan hydrolase-like protein with peptidoglycan-binding domain